jgi:hypothetical protein
MAEEFFRGGFSSGAFATGEVLPRLDYTLSVNNNLSQLGVTQANDSREMAYSGSLRWQPTTGEFGLATALEISNTTSASRPNSVSRRARVASRAARLCRSHPSASQIKMSDGINPFDDGALADGVTVTTLTYRELAIDAGVKVPRLLVPE